MAEFDYDTILDPAGKSIIGTSGLSTDVANFGEPSGGGGAYAGYQTDQGTAGVGEISMGPPPAPEFGPGPSQAPPLPYPVPGGSNQADVGQTMDTAGNVAIMSGNPYAMLAGGALKLGGMGLSAYGKYKEREEAKRRYDEQLRQWELAEGDRKRRQAREDARQRRQEGYFAAQYSQDLMDNLSGSYGGYRTPGADRAIGGQ